MFGSATHVRLYGLDIVQRLQKPGFAVESYTLDDIPGNYYDKNGRNVVFESEKYLFICRKQSMQAPRVCLAGKPG